MDTSKSTTRAPAAQAETPSLDALKAFRAFLKGRIEANETQANTWMLKHAQDGNELALVKWRQADGAESAFSGALHAFDRVMRGEAL